MTVVFAAVYLRITPVEELRLIKNGNLACALSFGGALVSFLSDAGFKHCPQRQLHRFYPWALAAAVIQILSISRANDD